MSEKSKNMISIESFDIDEMPKTIKPIGSPDTFNVRDCNWFAAHGTIDGHEINSPLIGVDRDKTRIFIGNTRKPTEFITMDMTDAKALRLAMDKLIDD